jgi:Protein of unknown function (DUF3631)
VRFATNERSATKDELLPTLDILEALNADKEAPWADARDGKGLSAEKLRSLLKPFEVKPVRKRTANTPE